MRSVVLLSGGLDSTVALTAARAEGEVRLALTFDYGQQAAKREIAASRAMCQRLGVPHEAVSLPWLAKITQTALVNDSVAVPTLTPEELEAAELDAAAHWAAAVWVPNRNGVFVNVAAAYAESLCCDAIVCGFNREEAATFPDNSAEYVDATNGALRFSTRRSVRIVAPTQDMSKCEIVRWGRQIGAPLDLVWSCYGDGPEQCGQCESCRRLQRALQQAEAPASEAS
ncbi:MAG: 7-cyano-7-deazaguanine synthase QueC [Armatimonadota bacterium]